MPRTTLALMILLLLGAAPQAVRSQQVDRAPSQDAASSAQSERRLPVQLVPRGQGSKQPVAGRTRGEAIPIPPPDQARTVDKPAAPRKAKSRNVGAVVLSSLAIVLGLFFLVVWLSRRALPKSSAVLPTDVLEVMGRSPLGNRHHLQLIRLGKRMLLVSVSPETARTLTEVTDPDEVDHLTGLCQQTQPGSISATFRQVLHQLGTQPPTPARRDRETTRSLGLAAASEHRRQ